MIEANRDTSQLALDEKAEGIWGINSNMETKHNLFCIKTK